VDDSMMYKVSTVPSQEGAAWQWKRPSNSLKAKTGMVGWPWLATRCPTSHSHSTSSTGQERENTTRSSWAEIRTGRSFTNYYHRQNRLSLEKLI